MKNDSDQLLATRWTLIERLKNWDDQESWRQFFDTYWKLIYGVAIKSGLTHPEAQDVVQETVMSVCKNMQKFKADPAYSSFKAWLVSCPSKSEIGVFLHAPGHPYYGQPQTARHRDVIPLDHRVTEGCVKLFPCQCRHEVNAAIACFDNRPFTCHHDAPPNTATRPGRVDEEGSNARWIAARVKLCIFARSSTVTP